MVIKNNSYSTISSEFNYLGDWDPKALITLPHIPLCNKATLEQHFIAQSDHKQGNEAFVAKLKQEQASNEWIQDLWQAIASPDTQKPNAKMGCSKPNGD